VKVPCRAGQSLRRARYVRCSSERCPAERESDPHLNNENHITSMNISTTYLGIKLRTPLVVAASPLSQDLDNIKKMEDAGAAAVVFHSLFEEQLVESCPTPQFRIDPAAYVA